MDWVEVIVPIIAIGGMFFWNRTESRNDIRHLEGKIDSLISELRSDIKDFHGRLCSLEERNKTPRTDP